MQPYFCQRCDRKLEPGEVVVVGAKQVEVVAQDHPPYYIDSVRDFFHERCWSSIDPEWAERDRGELRTFRTGAT